MHHATADPDLALEDGRSVVESGLRQRSLGVPLEGLEVEGLD